MPSISPNPDPKCHFPHPFQTWPLGRNYVIITYITISDRRIANMAAISPKRGFSVATVARVWLPVFTCAVAGQTAASQASFPLNPTKISQFSSLKKGSIWYVRFEYCFSMLN